MADTSILDTPIDSLTPTDTQAEPIATEPIATTAADPITGNNTGSSSSYSDSSNGNQVAVLSTLDYSTNLTIVNTTQQITYNTVYNYSSQATASTNPASTSAASASAASTSALAQTTANRVRLNSGLYFRRGRIDRIIGFDPTSGTQLALSSKIFRGIGEMEFRSVSTKKALQNTCKSSADIIYVQPQGKLYFNSNGEDRGFGRNGGLFAIIDQSPALTADHLLVV